MIQFARKDSVSTKSSGAVRNITANHVENPKTLQRLPVGMLLMALEVVEVVDLEEEEA